MRWTVWYRGDDILERLIERRDIIKGVLQNTFRSISIWAKSTLAHSHIPICQLSTVRSDIIQTDLRRVSIEA